MDYQTDKPTGAGSADGRMGTDNGAPEIPSAAFRDAANTFAQLKDYLSYYMSAKSDGIKTSVRNIVLYAAVGFVGLFVLLTIVVTASALFVLSIAHAFARLFHGHVGIGYLCTAILIFLVLGAGAVVGMSMLSKSSRKRTVEKYEHWKQQQRAKFGTDVRQQAQDAHR